jgi:hypothetical protein
MAAGSPIDVRPSGAQQPFLFVTGGNRPSGPRRGFAGTVAAVGLAAVGAVLFVIALVMIVALFVVAIAAALAVVAVRGLVHAVSPHRGERSVPQGGFGPASVIESTATVIRRAAPKRRV